MSQQPSRRGAHRALLPWFLGRAVLLAGLSAGLWLLGQTSASADEVIAPTRVEQTLSSVTRESAPSGEPPAAVSTAVVPVVAGAASPLPHVVEPVASATPVIEDVPVSGAGHAAPVEPVEESVRDMSAPVRRAAASVLAAGEPVVGAGVPAVQDAAPVVGVLDSVLPPVVDALSTLLEVDALALESAAGPGAERLDAVQDALSPVAERTAASTAGPLRAVASAERDAISAAAPTGAAANMASLPQPLQLPRTPAGAPSGKGCTGASSSDQSPADLSAAVLAATGAAQLAAGDVSDAVGNVAFDPSFSPD